MYNPFAPPKNNLKLGIIMMLASGLFFAGMNISVKHLGDTYNVMQISFCRCLFSMIPATIMVAMATGFGALKTRRWRHHFFRAISGVISMVAFFYSFKHLPLADAVALNYSAPLFVALFSVILLKEQVKFSGWAAIAVGFAGVVVITQPSSGAMDLLGISSGLVGALFYGFAMVGVRALGRTEAATTTVFYFTSLSMLFTAAPAFLLWKTPDITGFIFLAASGLLGGIAQFFMTRAFQYAPASVISPFGYAAILWAGIFGYLFWDEKPGLHMYTGAGIIIAAGLYIFFKEEGVKAERDHSTNNPLPPSV